MTTVIKLGGELALPASSARLEAIVASVAELVASGERVVVTHGGGPQVSALMRERGLTPRMVAGQRVTDGAALTALIMAVGGEVNVALTSTLIGKGVDAIGLTGVSAGLIRCRRRPPKVVASENDALVDYGLVGDVVSVRHEMLEQLTALGLVPVIACIGADERGRPLNVNGDTVAQEVAVALRADRLLLLTSTPGVLADKDDLSTRIPILEREQARAEIAAGVIAGGMIAKVEEAFDAVSKGVKEVHILGDLGAGDLERAVRDPGSLGTVLRDPS